MKKRRFFIFAVVMLLLGVPSAAYGVSVTDMANGTGTVVKIGITVLVVLLLLLTAAFAYGMLRSLRKSKDAEEDDEL